MPTAPTDNDYDLTYDIFIKESKEYMLRHRTYKQNLHKFYTIALGQCSNYLKDNLKGMDNLDTVHN